MKRENKKGIMKKRYEKGIMKIKRDNKDKI